MSDGEAKGPRRAWASDEPDTNGFDDTAGDIASGARRGSPDEPAVAGLGDEPATNVTANPFARPGSDSALAPAPELAPRLDVTPRADSTPIPAPVLLRSVIPSPAPRRSALSSTTPVEAEAPSTAAWFEAHRPKLLALAAAALALALVLGLVSFFIARGIRGTDPGPTPSGSPSASPSSSESAVPLTTEELTGPADLASISPASEWAEVATTQAVADHTSFAFCLSALTTAVNPAHSLQRTLSTATDDKLAALHRIDSYADEAAATTVMDERIAALSDCSTQLVAARIVGANSVEGLATRAFEINLASDDVAGDHHTLLLTQEGPTLQLLDVRRVGEPVTAEALATALTRPQQAINDALGVAGSISPVVTPAVVPTAEPPGWLIASDLPRIREGAGLWSASAQSALGTFGTGCENMNLATEEGPTERQVRRFQLTQDDQAPALFGVDQAVFTFDTPETAATFINKLGANIAGCKSRLLGSAVTELKAVASTGADGVKGSTRIFVITREQSSSTSNAWQAIVSIAGTRVSYTLVTVADPYKFSEAQLTTLADRTAVRLTQAP